VLVTLFVVAGLVALTVWQAGSWRVGLIVAAGFAGTAVVLHVAGSLLIRAIAPLARSKSFALRHAVLQLSRPGSQMRIVLLAVGLGSFFIIGVRSLQHNLVAEFQVNVTPESPDMFLLDVQSDQVGAVRSVLARYQPSGSAPARLLPVLRARVVGVEGRELRLEDYEDVRGRGSLAREYTITYRQTLEPNERIVAGALWDATASAAGEVSVEQSISERFRIGLGDTIRFDVFGRIVSAKVTSIRYVEWSDSRAGGFMFVFRPGLLEKAPHGFIGFLRGPDEAAARARMQADLVGVAPNVSVIDGREILSAIQSVVDNVTLAVTVVGTLVLFSGLLILVGAVAMTKFRRVYEGAIFKTLGATRQLIAAVLLLEYGLLGVLAGGIGAGGAMALTWGISRYALDIVHHLILPILTLALINFAGTMLLTRNSMLETLREDYVQAARAKGLPEKTIRDRHAARNAMLPVVTSFVFTLATVLDGGVITETVFSWPGMGLTLLNAAQLQDIPMIVGVLVFTGALALVAHLMADVLYAFLDPRIRYA